MKTNRVLFVNIEPEVSENIEFFFINDLKIRIISKTYERKEAIDKIRHLEFLDYLFIDPTVKCEMDEDLIKILSLKKDTGMEVIALTISDNDGNTKDSDFEKIGIKKIIRIPSSWLKMIAVILKK